MTRVFDGFVALEMVVLGVLELALCFLVFYVLLLPGDVVVGGHAGPLGLHSPSASHAAVLSLTISTISMAIGLYRPEICLQTRRLLFNSILAGVLAFPAVLLLSVISDLDPSFILGPDALWPMKLLLSWILLLFVTRLIFRVVLRSGMLTRRILIVGHPSAATEIEAAIRSMRRGFFSLADVIDPTAEGKLTAQELRARRIWGVVVMADAQGCGAVSQLQHGRDPGVRLFDDVSFREQQLRRVDLDGLSPGWLHGANGAAHSRMADAVRRAADIVVSVLILILTLPVMLGAMLLVRLTSSGPVLYRQVRVGLGGRRFTLLKFRSMYVDSEVHGPAWASRHDPRVTPVGRLMRHTRVDELPQLFNVLRGEMSLIGPRPERPHFVDQFNETIPHYVDRSLVKPGITGWAQVNYPYGASIEDTRQKLAYDLYYVKHRSLLLDVLILLATVRVILFQEGAR